MSRNTRRQPPLQGPPRWRLYSVVVVLALAAGAVILRALDLQVINSEFLRDEADARHLRTVSMPAHRGVITDRNGEPLAISSPVESAWANPAELLEDRGAVAAVAQTLERAPAELRDFLQAREGRQFVYLRRHLSPRVAARIQELDAPGVQLQQEFRRFYPAGEVAAQLVGFTDIDGRGLGGVERAFNEALSGRSGAKRVVRDPFGRTIEDVELLREPRPGEDIRLSLDRRIQYVAYRELKRAVHGHDAEGGAAVVLDATTGEVLAMVSQPSFNPHRRSGVEAEQRRNRAVSWAQEPGSVIKPFTIAAALSSGAVRSGQEFDTAPGTMRVGRHTVRDFLDYGELDIAGVLQKSSNVGTVKMALETEPRALWSALEDVGFGERTRSGLRDEVAGHFLPAPPRGDVQRATLSYGYGVTATPVQLARAYAAVARDGVMRPVSIRALDDPPQGRQVLDPDLAAELRAMLEAVVEPGGTGTRAAISGYRVAGKTGTVLKSGPSGYAEEDYLASFVGFAPASDPRLVMAVTIDQPRGDLYYGGQVAAPVFSRVMGSALRMLNVPPDDLPELEVPVVAEGEGS
ncbi:MULTISPECIES: peptidoglycan D,D-transpeptidase FtsI family protein [unclassified Halorhodospira]|uniref:peptidoglycan D,D-transpeptidase FtsI family protein n=1 Tax=unclassified Halorhodospira TaxID=2626748 RepID=UPI001EE8759C|nr:penicillin-binding protein 2 [Halorhodospira sp. M39old]MCG5546255.1 penicillin-binding protein 2 [Halorhodospira sp. M38]